MNGPFLSLIHYSNAMRQYTNYGNASNDKSAHPRVGPGLPPGANNTIHDSATVYNEQSATGPSGAISSQGPPQSTLLVLIDFCLVYSELSTWSFVLF